MSLALKGPFISIPHVALVPFRWRRGRETRAERCFDLVPPQPFTQLVLKRLPLVMLRLRADIFANRLDVRLANRFAFPEKRPFRSEGRFIILFPGRWPGLAEATFQVERNQANNPQSRHWVTRCRLQESLPG